MNTSIKTYPLLTALGLSLMLMACSKDESTTNTTQTNNVPSEEATDTLKIYNWTDYVDPDTLKTFENTHHIKIYYNVYDSDETLEAKVLSGRTGYDLVVPSNTFIGKQIKAGAYLKLDKSRFKNYANLNPKLLKMMEEVDPGNEYAIPNYWGINTFAINKEKVQDALGGPLPENEWDLVFDPAYTNKLKKCGITYLDSPAEMYPVALRYLGLPNDSSKTADIDAATELMQKNRANIKRFTSSGYVNDLARGDICLAVGFGGDLNIAKRQAEESNSPYHIEVLLPKTGFGIWVDSYVIPKDAVNIVNAYRYIDYTLEPEVAAKNGNYVTYAPASTPARDLMDDEFKNEPSIFPSDEDLNHGFIMVPLEPEALKYMMRQWQKFRAGH